MSDELVLIAPYIAVPSETVMPPVEEAPLPGTTLQTPQPEQVRIVEAVFTPDDKEANLVAGLMGMWTGTLLLHDLMVEHLTPPVGDDLSRRKKERDDDGPDR